MSEQFRVLLLGWGRLGKKHVCVDKSAVLYMEVWDPDGDVQQAIGYKSVMSRIKVKGHRHNFGS